jgi:hypothetical protein
MPVFVTGKKVVFSVLIFAGSVSGFMTETRVIAFTVRAAV